MSKTIYLSTFFDMYLLTLKMIQEINSLSKKSSLNLDLDNYGFHIIRVN